MWYSRFTFVENTNNNSPKVLRAKCLGSDGLFCFSSIYKFGSFRNPFATITSKSELYFIFKRFFFVGTNEKSAMNYGSSTSSWKPWRWGIYTSIPTWIHSQNSLTAREALSLKIESHRTSLKWSRRPSKSARE